MRFLTATPLLALTLTAFTGGPHAPQSGRGSMHGYVAFDDVSYNDVTEGKIQAAVELRGNTPGNHARYTAHTDNHGGYDIPAVGMGEYTLTITAPGHRAYRIDLYMPSDFECRLAVMLKKE